MSSHRYIVQSTGSGLWRGACRCGWEGPEQRAGLSASADARAHAQDAERAESASQERASAPLRPLPAQLDLDGGLHEIAPQTRQERLFEPAPTQLAGQTYLDTDHEEVPT